MYRVLSISRNVRLLLSRNNVLATAGFSVISLINPEEAPVFAAQQQIDAVVIGHSVSSAVRKSLITVLRHLCPSCVVCFVYAASRATEEPLADVSLDVTSGSEPLLMALQERLMRKRSPKRSRGAAPQL